MPRSELFRPARAPRPDPSLRELTGVRSGKKSYYVEMRRTEERMTSAVRALEGISAALVRSRDDPRGLLEDVLHAAAGHLQSDWTMIALRDGALPDLGIRFLARAPTGRLVASDRSLPASLRDELLAIHRHIGRDATVTTGWVRVPMDLDGDVLGSLVATRMPGAAVEHEDLWVLRILANQAAMSLHTAGLHASAGEMRHRAQRLYDQITRSSEDLQTRTAELQRAEGELLVLHQRELLDAERHRIALELHDSVAQYVLSAGLAVDVCRAEIADRPDPDPGLLPRLVDARDLIARAQDQVRSVIYALHHEPEGDQVASLPDLLQGLAAQHRANLHVAVRIEGRPVPMQVQAEHALARVAGEALFNISIHSGASRAIVRLRYTPQVVALLISDDGTGDPRELRRRLRVQAGCSNDGRHQGLSNMNRRAHDLGGTFTIRRSKLGGVRLEVRVPWSDSVLQDDDPPPQVTTADEPDEIPRTG